jgi:hypothetical protein
MRLKKVILIILLLFAVASLFVIAYSAKNKMGMFGKFYDSYVKEQTLLAGKTVKKNLDGVFAEVQPLSANNLIKSVFISSSVGENTDRYLEDISKLKDSLKECKKIQAFDNEGRVIFSTTPDEINTQKVKASIIQKLKDYFTSNTGLFVYFVDKNEFVSISPLAEGSGRGFVAVYYSNQRLLAGIPKNKMTLPYSFDNFMFLSSKSIDKTDMSKIVRYYTHPEVQSTNAPSAGNPTVGGIAQFNGLKMVYFAKNDRFIPMWTLLILILDLFLLGAVIFTLIQMFLENKMYKKVRLSSFDRDTVTPETPYGAPSRGSEIGDLVSDIEENRSYNGPTAEKGIEDMLLTSSVRLTESPDAIQELAEDDKITLEPGETVQLNEREKYELPDFDFKVDKPDSFKIKNSADLFAEQERILDGVDNKAFEEESLSFETPSKLSEYPEFEPAAPGSAADSSAFESVEAPDLQLSSDLEELEGIKPADRSFEKSGMDESLKDIPSEEEGIQYKSEKFADAEDLTISLGNEPDEINLHSRPHQDDDISLAMDTTSTGPGDDEKLKDITPFDELVPMEEIAAPADEVIPMAEPVQVFEEPEAVAETPTLSTEKTPAAVTLSPREYELRMKKVFVEPPVRLSCICTVADYGKAAVDIAKKSLNINKVMVLEKQGDGFKTILNKGFGMKDFTLGKDDPVYKMFLSQKKSLDISGDLKESRYLQERFSGKDIANVEEFFIMPIINKEDISGIAMFAREEGTPVPTNFQRSELFNLGFLQEM